MEQFLEDHAMTILLGVVSVAGGAAVALYKLSIVQKRVNALEALQNGNGDLTQEVHDISSKIDGHTNVLKKICEKLDIAHTL